MKIENIKEKARDIFNYVSMMLGKSLILTGIIMLGLYVWLYVGPGAIPKELFNSEQALVWGFVVWGAVWITMFLKDAETFTK